MSEQLTFLRSQLGNKLDEIGKKQYVFVMYEMAVGLEKKDGVLYWFMSPVVNLVATIVQNIGTRLFTSSGVKFAQYAYPRFIRYYLKQLPQADVLRFAGDLKQIGNSQDPMILALEEVLEDQVRMLNPHKTLQDVTPFLHTLGDLIIQNPPSMLDNHTSGGS